MMKQATISVVICTYNGAKFVAEQLDSVLRQTRPADEIIIQDDGSTDATLTILRDYAARYPVIRLFQNATSMGVNANFYSAMRRAQGDFIALCDQDDLWEADKLERQLAAIGHQLLCGGRSVPFSEDGSFVYQDPRRPNTTALRMMYCAEIAGHTMFFRRQLLDLLPMDCAIFRHNYYDMILSVVAAVYESVVYVDAKLVNQRRYHGASTYSSNADSVPTVGNGLRMIVWCVKHYREIKRSGNDYYLRWLDLLEHLKVDTASHRAALRMMKYQTRRGVFNFIRFQVFCLRHRSQLFHTTGSDPKNLVRAFLFPLTAVFYQRQHIR